ncbi:MAG TPA: hypothetical protein VJU87_03900 [Gemmatimonadaceae bacterium]|nr:hypothetical protein [Gemmatimonadaceae bacterium]
MRVQMGLSILAVACLVPMTARAQQKKVTCADNTIVTTESACATHGGKQKPGGLHRVGRQINKAAIDTKHEAERTPANVSKGAKTMGHNVQEAAGDVSHGAKKTAKKAAHGAGDVAEDASKGAQKLVHPKVYHAACKDGTTWQGRSKKNACLNHGGVVNWQ